MESYAKQKGYPDPAIFDPVPSQCPYCIDARVQHGAAFPYCMRHRPQSARVETP